MGRYWYAYTGNGDDTVLTNYIRVPWDPEFTCFGGSASCVIYSRPNSINPNLPTAISSNLQIYLTAGKALFDKYPNNGIQKPYIYTRSLS